jgi:preprotein translocase subunit YajC
MDFFIYLILCIALIYVMVFFYFILSIPVKYCLYKKQEQEEESAINYYEYNNRV